MQLLPAHRQALDPQLRQLVELAFADPVLDRRLQVVVGREDRQRILVALDFSLHQAVDVGLALFVRAQLGLQLLQAVDHARQPGFHRIAAHLQGVGQVAQLMGLDASLFDRLQQLPHLFLQPLSVSPG